MAEKQTCPRRMLELGPWKREEGLDTWEPGGHGLIGQDEVGRSCSFCGSLHPARFLELVRDGWAVGPTDKTYKAYIGPPGASQEAKFYYVHLSDAQQHEFIDLLNSKQMKIGLPGYFYVLPFFTQRRPAAEPE